MKKNVFLLISLGLVSAWLFSACASTQPSTVTIVQPANAELEQLRVKTTVATQTATAVTIDDENVVYIETSDGDVIEAESGKTYVFVDEDDSYERRMRMFDDPRYTVTVNLGWSDWYYDNWYYSAMYNPYYVSSYRWGFSWYTPSWMYPAYSMWYNPWYYSWHYPHYNPWCYGHHHHHHNYGWNHNHGWNTHRPNHYAYSHSPDRRSSYSAYDNSRRDNNSRTVASNRNPQVRQIAGSTRGTGATARPGNTGRGQTANVDRKVVSSRERNTGATRGTGITNNRGTGATTAIGTRPTGTRNPGTRETGITNNNNRGAGNNSTAIGRSRSTETRAVTPNKGVRNTQTYTRPESAGRSNYNQGNSSRPSSLDNKRTTTPSSSRDSYQSSGNANQRRNDNNSAVRKNDNNNNNRSSNSNSNNSNNSYRQSSSNNNSSSSSSARPSSSSSSGNRGGGSSSSSSGGGGSSRGGGGSSGGRR